MLRLLPSSPMGRVLPFLFLNFAATCVIVAASLFVTRFLVCRVYWIGREHDQAPYAEGPMCKTKEVEALIGVVLAWLKTWEAILTLALTGPLQTMSDKYGRKPFLIGIPVVEVVGILALMLANEADNSVLAVAMIFIASLPNVFSIKANFVTALVVADAAEVQARTGWYAKLLALGYVGQSLGFFLGSLISREISSIHAPFLVGIATLLLAIFYVSTFMPETRVVKELSDVRSEDDVGQRDDGKERRLSRLVGALLTPIRPLAVILPRRDLKTGRRNWNLMLLSASFSGMMLCGSFGSILMLYLASEFDFNREQIGWVLSWLTASRFVFLALIFPILLKYGRIAFHHYQLRYPMHAPPSSFPTVSDDDPHAEATPLLAEQGLETVSDTLAGQVVVVEAPEKLANHFDVILAFISIMAEALGFFIWSTTDSWKAIMIAMVPNSLSVGANACFKSSFLACVEPHEASASLAALEILNGVAHLISPGLFGSLYAKFILLDQPGLVFAAMAGVTAISASFLLLMNRL